MRIRLAKYNSNGIVAELNSEDSLETVEIWKHTGRCNPQEACKKAAEKLRAAADAFESLADESQPFQSVAYRKFESIGTGTDRTTEAAGAGVASPSD